MEESKSTMVETGQGRHHINRTDWKYTPTGDPRGYIQPHTLQELWFHTGTRCNLGCWFCLEGSGPKADRIEFILPEEARRYVDESLDLGVEQFSYTGGEPFYNPHMVGILDYALEYRRCLVLTNGTKPLREKLDEIKKLKKKPNALRFRVSLDFPDPEKHDEARGSGNFMIALRTLKDLHEAGFGVSIARHQEEGEDVAAMDAAYQPFLEKAGLPLDTPIISFPELYRPGDDVEVPYLTENCMTTYKDEKSRTQFMCAYSKMIVKIDGKIGVYACTLVDDDADYNLAETLTESMDVRVMMKHHRCFSCFAGGTSCSE